MKKLILFILSVLSFSAWAKEISVDNQFWASKYASWASQINKPQKVVSILPLSTQSQKMILKQIANHRKLTSVKMTITQLNPSKLQFIFGSKNKLEMDFHNYNKYMIYIQGKVIKLKKHKTFANYQSEIQMILNKRKKQHFFGDKF